ncbi:VOC family protein [Variovorax humicola]|uniref:VOC family protein n=1 Tax=Variovorax humicola TaxID=1769758 RepID=A0ABU8W8R8_9BURK
MEAYLSFNGNCAEAFDFYGKCLDGKTLFSMTFGDSPMGAQTPADYKSKIMHATFEARGQKIMGSDMPPGMPFEGYKGFSLSVQSNDVEAGRKMFNALAEGGKVTMPYEPTFWAAGFGMLVDKFGVPWMVNVEQPAAKG